MSMASGNLQKRISTLRAKLKSRTGLSSGGTTGLKTRLTNLRTKIKNRRTPPATPPATSGQSRGQTSFSILSRIQNIRGGQGIKSAGGSSMEGSAGIISVSGAGAKAPIQLRSEASLPPASGPFRLRKA